jgi:hypothetical protein
MQRLGSVGKRGGHPLSVPRWRFHPYRKALKTLLSSARPAGVSA